MSDSKTPKNIVPQMPVGVSPLAQTQAEAAAALRNRIASSQEWARSRAVPQDIAAGRNAPSLANPAPGSKANSGAK